MNALEAEVVIQKVIDLKKLRVAIWDTMEAIKLSHLQRREINDAADHISTVINDLEESL